MDIKLDACPYCAGTKIRYSTKVSKNYYQASFYCADCHCYGPRVLSKKFDTKSQDYHAYYDSRYKALIDSELKFKAAEAWNSRKASE